MIARPDHLGDLLLTLPAIERLRRRLPDARITCMVPRDLMPIAERAVGVDEVLPMPLPMRGLPPAWPRVRAHARRFRDRFDLALLPRPDDPWSGSLAAAASIPLRVGHPQPRTAPFLTHAVPERLSRHVAWESVALADLAAGLLGGDGSRFPTPRRSGFRVLPEDLAKAHALLEALDVGGAGPVVVHPTAGWPLKTWPVGHWRTLVAGVVDRLMATVLVVGQAPDRPRLDAITRALPRAHAISGVTLGTLAGLHRSARLVVGIDSGALHLAAAVGTPVVGLFGPFAPGRMGPLAPAGRARALWRSLPCSPCGTLEGPPCGAVSDPACLRAVTPEEMLAAVVDLDRSAPRVEE